jgi:hypothetical protein
MTNIKFNINSPDPSEEQINKNKDFNKLMYNYQSATKPLYKTPLYKNKKVFVIILLILLVMFIVIEIMEGEQQEVESKQQQQEQLK